MKRETSKKVYKLICFTILWMNLTACGTIINLSKGDYTVYSGVKNDFSAIQNGGVLGVLAVLDLPLSFAFDTLLLPVTLSK
ncbi:YceK/YidQ family lipoprotein [Haemophilus sp. Marseille-Q0026]|uniref:YceK/YidQ family lipoprotein n=1 Tax=Haemophilus sp. Marseille-Q0026 TaxID=2866580 RepID=UPI001CF92E89|nr:YceK/YidQ family lipoprotein [Haemophilus sp. Marseille-Q0026]